MSVYRDMLNKLEEQPETSEQVPSTRTAYAPTPMERLQNDLSRLVQSLESQQRRNSTSCVLFCGSNHGAGVTTIVRALAYRLNQLTLSGTKEAVIIIEALPNESLGIVGDHSGLTNVLSGKASLDSQIQKIAGVDTLRGPSGSPAWMNQISSGDLNSMLTALKDKYNWVLLDCPPTQGPESFSWSQTCDGVVLVLESSKTRRLTARNHVDQFLAHNANLLGCVLNKRRQHIPDIIYRMLFN